MKTLKVQVGIFLGAILLVLLVCLFSLRAQCTRSCGGSGGSFPSSLVTLYSFNGQPDGANPVAGLLLDALGNLYGTTSKGGVSNEGTVFKIDPSGKETVLHSFTGSPSGSPDGAVPLSSLINDAAGNLYGTTSQGGTNGTGTVFKLDTTGVETVLSSDVGVPFAGLVFDSSGNLFGTERQGGASNHGAVFKVDPAGNKTELYNFLGQPDGALPTGDLILDAAGNLYGTTTSGGLGPCYTLFLFNILCGTVFAVDPTGKETSLYQFMGQLMEQHDGSVPRENLVRDANGNLYGTTSTGGAGSCTLAAPDPRETGCGTVFKLDSTGKETVLHSFLGVDGLSPAKLLRDGAGNLYGTTVSGGGSNSGTVFKLDSTGTLTVLYSFTDGSDGGTPGAGLVLDQAGNLYGTTSGGGTAGNGTVFKLTPTTAQSVNLSVSLAGNGSGTVTSQPTGVNCGATCSASFSAGTQVTLTATPALGSSFTNWSGACTGSATTCGLVISAAESVTATFVPQDFAMSASPSSLNLIAGQSMPATLSITPINGATFRVNLACGALTFAGSCTVNPLSITLDGVNSAGALVTIGTLHSAAPPQFSPGPEPPTFLLLLASIVFTLSVFFSVRLKLCPSTKRILFPATILLVLGFASCGGSSSSGTAPGTYTVSITGASSSPTLNHSTTVTVNVTK